ncbi:MAG TPA: helix-turn-helix domain-containing protein [Caulobacteraceae bacterium]|jgi:AcrR family transcriptional regulator
MAAKDSGNQRRNPRQARSRATCEAIVEAAAQILERRGADGFNTNEVAERAGVSIGTLYQYFPDKRAILVAAARRELGETLAGRQQVLVRAIIDMIERLGGMAAPRAASSGGVAPRRRHRASGAIERRVSEALDLALDWLIPATPALRPIPIRREDSR